jgi:hypothetical protein
VAGGGGVAALVRFEARHSRAALCNKGGTAVEILVILFLITPSSLCGATKREPGDIVGKGLGILVNALKVGELAEPSI